MTSKRFLAGKEGIPTTNQRLSYNGRKAKDFHTVGFYNIKKEHTLQMTGRLRGGGKLVKNKFNKGDHLQALRNRIQTSPNTMKSNIIAHMDVAMGVFDKEAEVDAIAAITKLIERCTAEKMKSALEKIDSTNNIVYRQTILADHLFVEELVPINKVIDEHKSAIESTHAVFMCLGFM
ncbi:MAG: ubiquitin-like protein [Candidatus Fonsibacter sp.]